MGRPHESAELLLKGFTPSKIASKFGISTKSVKQYLFIAIGMGLIRRSGILFSIDRPVRMKLNQIIAELDTENIYTIHGKLKNSEIYINVEDLEIYLDLRKDGAFTGDLYVFLIDLEKTMHKQIEEILKKKYGEGEEGWWRKGIPQNVRLDCVKSRELDQDFPADPYCYSTTIHLKKIIDKNWALFNQYLPPQESSDKRALMKAFDRINVIRNKVMHPVRKTPPTEDEFEFIRDMHNRLSLHLWRKP